MAETLSYAKTELTKALLSLLKKKKLHEITISELCNKAGLSRLSYYRNYDSMEEIIREHLSGMLLYQDRSQNRVFFLHLHLWRGVWRGLCPCEAGC